jgi:hypothetical protein
MDDLLQALQNWYASHCDGEWEHSFGIKIETCDNPGWLVQIDLKGTALQARLFDPIAEQVDASGFQQGDRWVHCHIKDGVWQGAGDETKLSVILRAFLDWAGKT